MDHYKVLGFTIPPTKNQIKEAYCKMALHLHPDKHSSSPKCVKDDATRRFREVKDSYEFLMDDTKRAAYNRSRFGGLGDTKQADYNHSSYGGQNDTKGADYNHSSYGRQNDTKGAEYNHSSYGGQNDTKGADYNQYRRTGKDDKKRANYTHSTYGGKDNTKRPDYNHSRYGGRSNSGFKFFSKFGLLATVAVTGATLYIAYKVLERFENDRKKMPEKDQEKVYEEEKAEMKSRHQKEVADMKRRREEQEFEMKRRHNREEVELEKNWYFKLNELTAKSIPHQ